MNINFFYTVPQNEFSQKSNITFNSSHRAASPVYSTKNQMLSHGLTELKNKLGGVSNPLLPIYGLLTFDLYTLESSWYTSLTNSFVVQSLITREFRIPHTNFSTITTTLCVSCKEEVGIVK